MQGGKLIQVTKGILLTDQSDSELDSSKLSLNSSTSLPKVKEQDAEQDFS